MAFVAFGNSSSAASSPDGAAWTGRTISSHSWGAAASSGSVLAAVAGSFSPSTVAATSSDSGATWVDQVLPASQAWCGVAWNGSVFCAVASDGAVSATSPDGVTWTQHAMPAGGGGGGYACIAWNGTVFCAVGSGTSAVAATSPDGVTWTARSMSSSHQWSGIAWNGTVFAAVAQGPTSVAATSPDGASWTNRTMPSSQSWFSVAALGTTFCAVAVASTISATSPDGITWTSHSGLPVSQNWVSISSDGTVFCAVASGSNNVAATSPDGAVWTSRTLPTTQAWITVLGFSSGGGGSVKTGTVAEAPAASASFGASYPQLAFPTTWRSVRFQLPAFPDYAVSPASPGDALNPSSWSVSRADATQTFTPISVTQVNGYTFDVTVEEQLPSHLVALTVGAAGVLIGGAPFSSSLPTLGMTWREVFTPAGQVAQQRQVAVDLANPPTVRRNSAGLGGTLVIRGGDYATVSGTELVKKLIYRRLTTVLGGFAHLPNYGLGVLSSKDLIHPNDLVKLKAEVERQCRLEPEVTAARAQIVADPRGILYASVLAVTAPSGDVIQVSAQSGGIGA